MVEDHSDSVKETCCCHYMGFSFQLAARNFLYAPSHRQDSTYHGLFYTVRGVLTEMRNGSTKMEQSDDPLYYEWMLYHMKERDVAQR